MYDRLAVSAGGGIIPGQQEEQRNCATIAIGLGGTGIDCLRNLKKNVFTRVKPDKCIDYMPKYDHIKFMAIDTDKDLMSVTGRYNNLVEDEFFDIGDMNSSKLLDDSLLLYKKPEFQWLKVKNFKDKTEVHGIRQMGRLMLIAHCRPLVEKLTAIINDARRDLTEPSLNVHIFTGLAGATGGAIFLDLCYILQHVLENMGLAAMANTCGYFFLPDVNTQKYDNIYLRSNGFAAMKELDYCMNFDNNGGKWVQQYDGFKIETVKPPVKLAHLITTTQENGSVITDGYNYVMNVVADYVLEYVVKPFEWDDTDPYGTFTLESHLNNITTHIGQVHKTRGGCYNYSVIGAASAYVPYKDINTYLASKIFEGFERIKDKEPTAQQVEEFVQNNDLRYEDIKEEIQKGVPDVINYDVVAVFGEGEDMSPDKMPGVFKALRDDAETRVGEIEENIIAVKQDVTGKTDESPVFITAINERIKKALIEIATDPDKGLYYASHFLSSDKANNLLNKIDGYKKQQEEELSNLYVDLKIREEAVTDALRQLKNSNKGNRDEKVEDYQTAVRSFFYHFSEIIVVKVLRIFLVILKSQLKELKDDFFDRFESVMHELIQTFEANITELSDSITADTGYTRKLVSVADLKDSLDKVVAEMNIPNQIRKFTDNLIHKPEVWKENDDNKISAEVIEYFNKELDTYTSNTMIEYLKNKYNTSDALVLSKMIEDDIIANIDGRANVYMWLGSDYDMSSAVSTSFLSIPYVQEIDTSAKNYVSTAQDNITWTIRYSYSSDRISLLRIRTGIPLFAYIGVEKFFNDYKSSNLVGQHIYEGTDEDPRDFRKLPNIAPLSMICQEKYSETFNIEDDLSFINSYDYMLQKGIITFEKNEKNGFSEYYINVFNADEIMEIENRLKKLEESYDVQGMTKLLQEIEGNKFLKVTETMRIPNHAHRGYEEQVIKDKIFSSLLYKETAIGSYNTVLHYEKVVEKIKKCIADLSEDVRIIENFADALITGVIRPLEIKEYVAILTDSQGVQKLEYHLTNVDKKPFGSVFPLYSAFLGYKLLNQKEKNNIREAHKEFLEKKDVLEENFALLNQELSVENIKRISDVCTLIGDKEGKKIQDFYLKLSNIVKCFSTVIM